MDRIRARRLALAALGLGIAADLGLDGPALGLNAPLIVTAVLVAAWLFRRTGRAPDPLDAWLPVAALLTAGFIAIRADPILAGLNAVMSIALTGASVAAFSGLVVTRRSASVMAALAFWVITTVFAAPLAVVRSWRRPLTTDVAGNPVPPWAAPVARGLILAIPLAMLFAILFASADPIFRRGLDDVLGLRIDLGDLPGRVLFSLSAAWLVGGLLWISAAGIPALERSSLGAAAWVTPRATPRRLGTTEALVVLVVVDFVVGAFVGLQIAYLFGGLDTLAVIGLTYSDYARRGYFELVGAAGLAGGVIVGLDLAVSRRARMYVLVTMILVGLTVLVLASAAYRLHLYQDAYGWTELRLYIVVSMAALAAALVALGIAVARALTRRLGHALFAIGLVALMALNLLAPAAFVAERNLARVIDPSLVPPDGWAGLDAAYLRVLPDDAVPELVAALPRLPALEAAWVRDLLVARRIELAGDPSLRGFASWNLGRERARAALATLPIGP